MSKAQNFKKKVREAHGKEKGTKNKGQKGKRAKG